MRGGKIGETIITAVGGGMVQALKYVNPYKGELFLSELVQQLSGSRGDLPMACNFLDLTEFGIRTLPGLIFCALLGMELYRHYCTASVYVFSRCPKRIRWYRNEAFMILLYAGIFQSLMLLTVIGVTLLRYTILVDMAGIILFLFHDTLYSLCLYCITLSVNLLAVYFGSSMAYEGTAGFCLVLTGLLALGQNETGKNLLYFNPAAHLVLCWHTSSFAMIRKVLQNPYPHMNLEGSLGLFVIFGIVITIAGAVILNNHDLLVSDMESNG